MLNVGVIGLGVGARHAEAFQAHPDCRVAALCDLDPAKKAWAAENLPGAVFYEKAEDLIKSTGVDLVSVASYDDVHFDQAAAVLKQGKHLFVEKPVCQFPEQLAELRKLSDRHPESLISSNLVLRLSPRFQRLKTMIKNNDMGNVYYLEGDYNYGRLSKITEGWRGKLGYYSVIQGGAIHMLDLLMWLTGWRVEQVNAYGNNICTREGNVSFDDFVVGLLRFKGGGLAKVAANFGCVMPHFHNLTVYGTKATFINELPNAKLFVSRDQNIPFTAVAEAYRSATQGNLIHSFVDHIMSGKKPLVGKEDVFASMSVCLALDKSLAEQAQVDVTYY